jgi:hypothetical protein
VQSKVTKRSWVLQECLNRSTVDYFTTRKLLEYGLTRTSFRYMEGEMGGERGKREGGEGNLGGRRRNEGRGEGGGK